MIRYFLRKETTDKIEVFIVFNQLVLDEFLTRFILYECEIRFLEIKVDCVCYNYSI